VVDDIRKNLHDERDRTDRSLGAERALGTADVEARTQRRFVDLIEHDRLVVDARLSAYRDGLDQRLAGERSVAPSAASSLTRERDTADEALRLERQMTDKILDEERRRSDDAVYVLDRHDLDIAAGEERRKNTDENLSTERQGVDDAVDMFGITRQAANVEGARHREVVAAVSHELNNALAVIAISGQLLLDDAADPEARSMAGDVVRSAARMTRLVSDLLDGARIDGGSFRIAPSAHDVDALLREIRSSYTPLFDSRQLRFTVETMPSSSPRLVHFDHDRVVQVLSNLLSNAMKFTPAKGSVRLRANLEAESLVFEVHDSGPGIPRDALPRVFDRFWQAGSEVRSGLGLGLYICKTIVEAHGGQISVESEPGKGTCFRFTLPTTGPAKPDGR
jgi:signal transduction histidine kinase